MYCSSCGIEVSRELNYCNRCGASLNPSANQAPQVYSPPPRLTGPIIALGVTVVFSLMAIFGSVTKLFDRGVHPAFLTWMVIFALALVFGVVGLITRLLTTLLKNSSVQMPEQPPAQLRRPQQSAQIPAPQTGPMNAPISSVTDHTTRTFDPVYRERK
ncbi:MAG: hypothetical protein ICV60_10550 [Pyrinomonadaceae bacterium]|nr:hypothetical protein [Pyrinomonadaceae bacterium]